NGARAKPHRKLAVGDRVEIDKLRDWTRVLVVRELRDRPLPKAEAARLFEDLSPPPPEPDPIARLMRQPPVHRPTGAGGPSKRDRRRIERLRGT
ncbi:MAG: RNA-binding S4 domain-containing protein, partial [Thermoanaerobaculia bacterium]|nr:RNA-binding S4 domain-containing protein [Thermoanaerobaculia bacterium]